MNNQRLVELSFIDRGASPRIMIPHSESRDVSPSERADLGLVEIHNLDTEHSKDNSLPWGRYFEMTSLGSHRCSGEILRKLLSAVMIVSPDTVE